MDPKAVATSQLGLFEAAAANGQREEAAALHPFAVSAAAEELGEGSVWSLRKDGPAVPRSPASRQASVAEMLGVRFHERSGLKEVLLRRPTVEESGGRAFAFQGSSVTESALSPSLAAALLHAPAPVGATLEPSPGPPSPLRRLAVSGVATGSEVSDLLRDALLELQRLTSESPAAPSGGNLQLRCAGLDYQARFSDHGHTLEALVSEPQLELHSAPANPVAQNLSALLATEDVAVRGLVPLRSLCGLRAVARLLAAPFASLAAGEVAPPPPFATPSTDAKPLLEGGLGPERAEAWLQRLAAVHETLLRALGFQSLDPGSCWDEKMFTFAACCSVGENQESCWHGGYSEERPG
eukprot:s1699_g4.t1